MSELTTKSQDFVFNARWLTPSQVAETFVAPPYFERLAASSHTLLIGPRGSGKTTLLKMLQPRAIESWAAEEGAHFRSIINYTGIFIPADISWREQLDSAVAGQSVWVRNAFCFAAFTTSVLHAVVDGALRRLVPCEDGVHGFRRATLAKEAESDLVRAISEQWRLPKGVPSLLSLKHRLRARLAELPVLVRDRSDSRELLNVEEDRDVILGLPPLECVSTFVEMFDDYINEPDAKWALLFDEMEIAPDWIRHLIYGSTRSKNDKLLLKLALSPYTSEEHEVSNAKGIEVRATKPSPLNDFDQIQLWYAHRDQGVLRGGQRQFCIALWNKTIESRGFGPLNPYKVLGESFASFDNEDAREADLRDIQDDTIREPRPSRRGRPYSQFGKWGARFQSLYEKDSTFRAYLDRHGLSPLQLDSLPEAVRARVVRKVTAIVAFRDFYRRADPAHINVGVRSSRRGTAELFAGAETFFLLSEGHPRWLKVILGRMFDRQSQELSNVTTAIQASEVLAFGQRFAALLKTYPSGAAPSRGGPASIWALVKTIGGYFFDQVVTGAFDPEPYLSFTVDSNTSPEIVGLVQTAVNLGALVYVPDGEGEILLRSVRGKRFRISYWLTPLLRVPPILGKEVALSTILSRPSTDGQITEILDLPFKDE